MSEELDRLGEEALDLTGGQPRPRGRMSAVEQMMRIYGADFIRAFKALGAAHALLDAGSVAHAGTQARFAAYMLRESGIVNDRGRSRESIVVEICEVFKPKPMVNFQGAWIFDEACIVEITVRLECSRWEAIGLLKEWHEGSQNKQLEAGPQEGLGEEVVDGEVTVELGPGDK